MSCKEAERRIKFIWNRKCRRVENDLDSEEEQEYLSHLEGRGIVHLSLMAKQMRECRNCSKGLFLHNIAEGRYGLGSIPTVIFSFSSL